MYAIIGIPGSTHHDYRWFPRSELADARAWLQVEFDRTLLDNPVLGTIETRLLPDREAERLRYRDGTHIYSKEQSQYWDAIAPAMQQAEAEFWAAVEEEARGAHP